MPAIELEGVDVPNPLESAPALAVGAWWRIQTGEGWLLDGAPGCGKSTLLQVVASLLRPSRGVLRLFGRDVSRLREGELLSLRSRVGFVFGQGGRLFSQLTVEENLALPLRYHAPAGMRDQGARTRLLLEAFELTAYAQKKPRELPRLLAPRLALARALALGPEVLLLDEPTAGLPPAETRWWLAFVATCLDAGRDIPGLSPPRTIVVASQDAALWGDLRLRRATLDAEVRELRTGEGAVLRPPAGS